MRVIVIDPPAPVVTWEDVDAHLRLDGDTDHQVDVEGKIAAAVEHLDAPDGWLGRALGEQVLEARFDAFHEDGLFLPFPPIVDLVSVSYLDPKGELQPMDVADCELFGRQMLPAHGKRFPATLNRREAVRVRYRAGYVKIPAPIRSAILLMVGDLFANRETKVESLSTNVTSLLNPLRIYS